ncbi:JAB domain-containing protein [Sphingomonas suaedae]|uniref:JAB domain-containing protein n=1 Tax=Sphingomonas suaedae TaxID=2599297 RepID=UPI0016461143|nr:JAB domain-containing protein [Sphingomonas suaedae]
MPARAWSGELIRRFGSLGGVVDATSAAIARASSVEAAELILAHRALLEHSLRDRAAERAINASGAELRDYLVATMGDARTERLRVLYLDAGNRLLGTEEFTQGSPTSVQVAPRTILKRAFEFQAVGVILVHNHPGGDSRASPSDIRFTRAVASAGAALGIALHDHLIVAGGTCTSLRAAGAFQ